MTKIFVLVFCLLSITAFAETVESHHLRSQKSMKAPSFTPFPDLVKALNYPVSTHKITTEDGYILTFFRIQAKNQTSFKSGLPVIYLQHGLLDSADTWVINDEANSVGLQLANQGYDIWLGNSRGNKYSLEHVVLKPSDPQFWQFTFQNMSQYDLPAAFDYIHRQTDQMINYIGHSQGTLIMFAALSDRDPTVLKYLKKYIALAPVAWVAHITAGPVQLIAHTSLAQLLVDLHQTQFFPANWAESEFGHIFCKTFVNVCGNVLGYLFGADPDYDNYKQYNIILEHEPSGTSVTNMLHWRQLVLTAKFNKFDYGTSGNMLHYGQPSPPDYNVSNINVPLYMFMGTHDNFVDERDTQTLLDALKGNPDVYYKEYNADHMTFLWSKDLSFYFNDLLSTLSNN